MLIIIVTIIIYANHMQTYQINTVVLYKAHNLQIIDPMIINLFSERLLMALITFADSTRHLNIQTAIICMNEGEIMKY